MKIAIIKSTYMEQHAIEAFFGEVFGYGKARVTVSMSSVFPTQGTESRNSGLEGCSNAQCLAHSLKCDPTTSDDQLPRLTDIETAGVEADGRVG